MSRSLTTRLPCFALLAACSAERMPASPHPAPPDSATDSAVDSGGLTDPAPTDEIVVLFTFDTVRQESFNPVDMPNVMALASDGLWVPELWHSGAWTYMGCSTINSGHSPIDFGAEALVENGDEPPALPDAAVTLGDLAIAGGVPAAAITQSRMCGDRTNQDQGWESFNVGLADGVMINNGLAWLETHADNRALLWLHSRGGHDPYWTADASCSEAANATGLDCPYDIQAEREEAASESILDDMNEAYLAAPDEPYWPSCDARVEALNTCQITATDRDVATLVSGLEARGLLDRTTLVILSDHGEGWSIEHEQLNHGNNLHAAITRGAAVIWNNRMSPDTLIQPAGQIDILPTVASVLSLEAGETPGVSLLDDVPADRVFTQFWCGDGLRASGGIQGGRHYIRDSDGESLFDTVNDPLERTNLIETEAVAETLGSLVLAQEVTTMGYCGTD